jgi:hypothetical protein
MNESRKSKRHRKAARSAREWSRARRLSIEAMEGRVLLSGNSPDPSTFVADITPASYGPAIVPSVDSSGIALSYPNTDMRWSMIATSATVSEGGFADFDLIQSTRPKNINVSTGHADFLGGSTDSNLGLGGRIDVGGGPEPRVVLSYDGGVKSAGAFDNDIALQNDAQGGFVPSITPREIAPLSGLDLTRAASVASEGGAITVASIRTEFMRPTLAENTQTHFAATFGSGVSAAEEARDLAASKPEASVQLDGEWTRAIAMESLGTSGSLTPADHLRSREAAPDSATKTGHAVGPLSSNEAQTHDGEVHADDVVVHDSTDGQSGQPIGVPVSTDRAVESSRVTPVAWTSTSGAGDGGIELAPAHRLETNGRGVRQPIANMTTAADRARDEAYSEWHLGLAADDDLDSNGPSEHRFWVNPGPFLAVLALERFVSLEPREKNERRSRPR